MACGCNKRKNVKRLKALRKKIAEQKRLAKLKKAQAHEQEMKK